MLHNHKAQLAILLFYIFYSKNNTVHIFVFCKLKKKQYLPVGGVHLAGTLYMPGAVEPGKVGQQVSG